MYMVTIKMDFSQSFLLSLKQDMDDNPLGELCKGVVDISKCNILNCELLERLTHFL